MILTCPACATRYEIPAVPIGPGGKKVKCRKCGHVWRAMPESESASPRAWEVEDGIDGGRGHQDAGGHGFGGAGFGGDGSGGSHGGYGAGADSDDFMARLNAAAAAGEGGETSYGAAAGENRTGWRKWVPTPAQVIAFVKSPVAWGGAAVLAAMVAVVLYRGTVVSVWPPSARLFEAIGFPVEPLGYGLRIQNVHAERRMEEGSVVLVIDGQVVNDSQVERMVPSLRASLLGVDGGTLRSWRVKASQPKLAPGAIAVFQVHEASPGAAAKVVVTFDGG